MDDTNWFAIQEQERFVIENVRRDEERMAKEDAKNKLANDKKRKSVVVNDKKNKTERNG